MTCPVCGVGKTETVNHCPACKSEWYGGTNVEKVYRAVAIGVRSWRNSDDLSRRRYDHRNPKHSPYHNRHGGGAHLAYLILSK